MIEVDAPLDDANVGRFIRLLDQFKARRGLVITQPAHHASRRCRLRRDDAGAGGFTIVGVRLGEQTTAA